MVFEVKSFSAPPIAFKQRHNPNEELTVVNQFAALNQQNTQYCSLDVYCYHTENSYMYQSARARDQRKKPKQYCIKLIYPFLYTVDCTKNCLHCSC